MAFRLIEISHDAELHIKNGQLEITQAEGISLIPIEDIEQIMTIGPNIRLSTMDLSILCKNKVALTTLDQKYLPTAIVLPFEGNVRQSRLIHKQVEFSKEKYLELWAQIIAKKITNQATALSILGFDKSDIVAVHADNINKENIDSRESCAARDYFSFYHGGLNRRADDPINSRLNYGYAVVRSSIARSAVAAGFHPAFGIHHNNQLNPFNLADDLIEPFRPMVDLVAHENSGTNDMLTKAERYSLAGVLYNACIVNGTKVNILTAITEMCESLKRIIYNNSNEHLRLPTILPIERIEGVTE